MQSPATIDYSNDFYETPLHPSHPERRQNFNLHPVLGKNQLSAKYRQQPAFLLAVQIPYEIASDEDEFFAYVFLDPIDQPFTSGEVNSTTELGNTVRTGANRYSLWQGKHRWESQNGRTAQDRRMDPSRQNAKKVDQPKAKVNGIVFTT